MPRGFVMHLNCEDCGGAVLITLNAARFDTTNAWEIRDELRGILRDDRDIYLFDLGRVNTIDSTGVGTLIGFVKYAGRASRVELCGMSSGVTKVFRLTNLLSLFTIHQDADEGLLAHRAKRAAVNQ